MNIDLKNLTKDIGWLMEREHLFANKFDTTSPYSDAAVQCIEARVRKSQDFESLYKQYVTYFSFYSIPLTQFRA